MVLVHSFNNYMNQPMSASHPIAPPAPGIRHPFIPPPNIRGVFAGAGADGMGEPSLAQAVVDLTGLPPEDIRVLYIGTATYDVSHYRERQTRQFTKMGCHVRSLNVANFALSMEEMEQAVDSADVLLVSGGNTLYAVERWKYLGLDILLKMAAYRGAVMAGGSAGAICWFDGGHSDSMDPDTYRPVMLAKYGGKVGEQRGVPGRTRYYGVPLEDDNRVEEKDWDYIRVNGLGILPGLICPHFDRVQSNGVPRLVDFDNMMQRHSAELGIGIDHFAALLIDGNEFRVLSIPGKPGSVQEESADDYMEGYSGVPGVWVKFVDPDGRVWSKVCPPTGKVEDLMQMVQDPTYIVMDERVELCKKENAGPKDNESPLGKILIDF